jgi:hypothetical protein
MRMARRVTSGRRLPAGPPRGPSSRPAGPCCWNLRFQAYRVCLETPTRGAKSPAGRPLRRQASKSSRRCWPVRGWAAASFRTRRRPRTCRLRQPVRAPGSAGAASAARAPEPGASRSAASPPGSGRGSGSGAGGWVRGRRLGRRGACRGLGRRLGGRDKRAGAREVGPGSSLLAGCARRLGGANSRTYFLPSGRQSFGKEDRRSRDTTSHTPRPATCCRASRGE